MAIDHAGERGKGTRLLLLRADGCMLCVSLDAVQGVHACDGVPEDGRITLPGEGTVAAVRWADVSGVQGGEPPAEPRWLAVVRTPEGPVALQAEECLGVREVSLLESPPVPTHLADSSGSPLCYVLLLNQQPCFLIEPRALRRGVAPEELPGPTDGTPRRADEPWSDGATDG